MNCGSARKRLHRAGVHGLDMVGTLVVNYTAMSLGQMQRLLNALFTCGDLAKPTHLATAATTLAYLASNTRMVDRASLRDWRYSLTASDRAMRMAVTMQSGCIM